MTFQIYNFFEKMQGSWIIKQTIYYPKEKELMNYQENVNIQHNTISYTNNQVNYSNITLNNCINCRNCYIEKQIRNDYCNQYICHIDQEHLIKLKISKYGMNYLEYIYNISINFKISIAILKCTTNYVAIIFTSYIKTHT